MGAEVNDDNDEKAYFEDYVDDNSNTNFELNDITFIVSREVIDFSNSTSSGASDVTAARYGSSTGTYSVPFLTRFESDEGKCFHPPSI